MNVDLESPVACPSAEELASFAQGRLDDSRSDVIRRHVESCKLCGATSGFTRADGSGADSAERSIVPDAPTCDPFLLGGRYRLGATIAQGGMGVVHRATDEIFSRPVAIKRLLPGHRLDPRAGKRFRYEAELTARLQHPGVPPMHDLGETAEGPYLAMKLIAGDTLAKLLRERRDAAHDLPRFLAIFEQIAQTVGYAHSQGVIHRDLKPANVMVGAFGEVQVMDWGLAKELSAREEEVAREKTALDGSIDRTLEGEIVGTLAYMPPEQARGEITKLDARADVFSLGAMLVEILGGGRIYAGQTAPEVLATAMRGDVSVASARLRQLPLDGELVEIALSCAAPATAERPANGAEVARRIAEHRAAVEVRLRRAESERAAAETATREQVKRRRIQAIAGGAIGVVLLLGVAGTTYGLLQAEAKRKIADQRTQMAFDALQNLAEGVQEKLEGKPDMQELRAELLATAEGGLTAMLDDARRFGKADRTLATVHVYKGDVAFSVGDMDKALAEYESGRAIAQRLVDAAPQNVESRRDLSVVFSRLGGLHENRGRGREAEAMYAEALALDRQLAAEGATDEKSRTQLAVSLQNLGDVRLTLGQTENAVDLYAENLTVVRALADADPTNRVRQQEVARACYRLGDVFQAMQRSDDMLRMYEESLSIDRKLAQEFPHDRAIQYDLAAACRRVGEVRLDAGDVAAATPVFEEGLALIRRLADEDPKDTLKRSDLALMCDFTGDAYLESDRIDDAKRLFYEALAIRERFTNANPGDLEWKRQLSYSYERLGVLLGKTGPVEEELRIRLLMLSIRAPAVDADSKNPEKQYELALAFARLGDVYTKLERHADALLVQQECLRITRELAAGDRSNRIRESELVVVRDGLADTLMALDRPAEAAPLYAENVSWCETELAKTPDDKVKQHDLSFACAGLAQALDDLGRTEESFKLRKRDLELAQALFDVEPTNEKYRSELVFSRRKLAQASAKREETEQAIIHTKAGLELIESSPDRAEYADAEQALRELLAELEDAKR